MNPVQYGGIVIILDREESNISQVGQSTKNTILPSNQEFILSLSGDSERIDTIVADMYEDQVFTS